VDEARDLEEGVVSAIEEDGDGGSAGARDHSAEHGGPGFVGDFAALEVEARNFAGGEHGEEAAIGEMTEALADGGEVMFRGIRAAERIDEVEEIAELGDATEHVVAHDFYIRAGAGEHVGQHDAIDAAKGMIGDDDDGAFLGDAGEFGFTVVVGDAEVFEDIGDEGMRGGRFGGGEFDARVDIIQAVEGEEAGDGVAGGGGEAAQEAAAFDAGELEVEGLNLING